MYIILSKVFLSMELSYKITINVTVESTTMKVGATNKIGSTMSSNTICI